MLTMCRSWFFFFLTLLLVQPSQALYNYHDIRSVLHSREFAGTRGIWLRTFPSLAGRSVNKGTSPGTVIAVVLALLALLVGAVGTFIWYSRRRTGHYGNMPTTGVIFGWWHHVRHATRQTDIEKGAPSATFHSRFTALRSAGREGFERRPPPQVVVEEPPAPLLPHIQKYPSALERSRTKLLLPNTAAKNSQGSRVLVPPPPARGPGIPARQDPTKSPTEYMKSWSKRSQNPIIRNPDEVISSPQDSATSLVPLDTPPDTASGQADHRRPEPGANIRKLDQERAERVRALHMDLTQDFRGLDSPLTRVSSMRVMSAHQPEDQLRKAKTMKSAKNLRFMLPSSPRSPLQVAPLRSAVVDGGGDLGKSKLRPLLSASHEYSHDWRPPKTAFV
ncbi:hypothetical protein APHAL10511_002115 [Amanita phalloides]|nr:hypothetical protein APHAL10511_002115 [Amanita phalloides]